MFRIPLGQATKAGCPTEAHVAWVAETITRMARRQDGDATAIPDQLRKLRGAAE